MTLLENIIWQPEAFIERYAYTLLLKVKGGPDRFSKANMLRIRQNWLHYKCNRLWKETQLYCIQITTFILKMRSSIKGNSMFSHDSATNNKINCINQRGTFILQVRVPASDNAHLYPFHNDLFNVLSERSMDGETK